MSLLALREAEAGISLCLSPGCNPVSWYGQLPGTTGDNSTGFLLKRVKKGKLVWNGMLCAEPMFFQHTSTILGWIKHFAFPVSCSILEAKTLQVPRNTSPKQRGSQEEWAMKTQSTTAFPQKQSLMLKEPMGILQGGNKDCSKKLNKRVQDLCKKQQWCEPHAKATEYAIGFCPLEVCFKYIWSQYNSTIMKNNKFAFRRHPEELSSPVGLDDKFRHGILSDSYYLLL